ncbi:MAG: VCBS repeat-containing protein [Polyangiales bacterium]
MPSPRRPAALFAAALLGASAAGAGGAEDVARALDAPLRESAPEARHANAVGVRVVGAAPAPAREALARALVAAVPGAIALDRGDDLAAALAAARAVSVPRALVVETDASGAGVASLHVVDPGPWFTFLAAAEPAPRRVASVPVDAPRPVPAARPRTVATPFRGVAALALADLDGDRRDELVLVTGDRARVARFQGASLAFVREAPASAAPRRAPVPLRQPLGAAARDGERPAVRFRTSTHASLGEVTIADGAALVRSLDADLYPAPGLGCVHVSPAAVVDGLSPRCDGNVSPARLASVPAARGAWEVRAEAAGRAEVRRDGTTVATLTDVAAPFALDDLDGDGTPELVTASASAWGAPDRVRVFALGATVDERSSVAVPGPVEALGVGDLDGDGRREVVASVLDPTRGTSTLWILR